MKQFIPTLVDLHLQGRFLFDKLVKRYPFERINEAVADLHDRKVLKPIVEFG